MLIPCYALSMLSTMYSVTNFTESAASELPSSL
jgi:hypothetical protein